MNKSIVKIYYSKNSLLHVGIFSFSEDIFFCHEREIFVNFFLGFQETPTLWAKIRRYFKKKVQIFYEGEMGKNFEYFKTNHLKIYYVSYRNSKCLCSFNY